ncbi:MAG TPA: HEAT repeat domain-containing protein [Gemmataceae bacterium]|nr:HEAT repeat domain-containing protein [Gemmataceae bacterium]
MRIYFRCGQCHRALSDLATRAGQPAVCPNCQADLIVPPRSTMAPPEEARPTPKLDKTNPAAPSSVPAHRPNRKAWIYSLSAAAVLALALGVVGAVVGSPSWWQKDKALVLPLDDGDNQVAEESEESPSTITLDCCKGNPTSEEKKSEESAEQTAAAKLSAEKKGQDLVNDLAKPVKPAAKPEVVEKPKRETDAQIVVKRRQKKSEEELRKELAWVPEIGLGTSAQAIMESWKGYIGEALRDANQNERGVNLFGVGPITANRPDLGGLPFRQGNACRIKPSEATVLADLAPKLRLYLIAAAPMDLDGHRTKNPVLLRETLRNEMRGKRPAWLRYEAIPSMLQLMMPEDTSIRMLLVDMLAEIPEKQATVALAQRAIFDLSPDVRDAALTALKKRNVDDYRSILLNGTSYVWAPVADHAAEAIIALNVRDNESIGRLIQQLDEPSPSSVQILRNRGGFQREVVRAAHLTNCLLCHPPSANLSEGVLAEDPVVTIPTSATVGTSSSIIKGTQITITGGPFLGPRYPYEGAPLTIQKSSSTSRTDNPITATAQTPLIVRGDITYVRQDYSAFLPVLQPGTTLPAHMRFDFFVRTKWMPEKKARELKTKLDGQTTYPQRESVLFALRELTGQDAGQTSEAWLKLFPRAELDVEAAKYRDKLVDAVAKKRGDAVLTTLKEGEGVVYTAALADAIPKLPKDFRDKARQALAERLSRMTADTLRNKFQEDDVEIRRAAVQASIIKGDLSLVSDLSELLEDPNPAVAGLADDAIKTLSKSKKKQKPEQPSETSASAKGPTDVK